MATTSKIAAYREAMIARKAAAAGMSVADFLAKGERDAAIARRASELRTNVAAARSCVVNGVLARGNLWIWS